MFDEQYKNDNEKIIASEELIGKTRTKMVAAVTDKAAQKKHFALKGAVAFSSVIAVVCFCAFGNFLPKFNNGVTPPTQTAKSDNSFILTAYAAEQHTDGTVTPQRQLEFVQYDTIQSEHKLAITSELIIGIKEEDGEQFSLVSLFKNIAFKCDGANIKSVTFSVDEGYFSRTGNDYALERIGTSYTMDKPELKKGNMIYWGIDISGENVKMIFDEGVVTYTFKDENVSTESDYPQITYPQSVNVKAVATFEDGEVQEKMVVYDTQKGTLVLNEK